MLSEASPWHQRKLDEGGSAVDEIQKAMAVECAIEAQETAMRGNAPRKLPSVRVYLRDSFIKDCWSPSTFNTALLAVAKAEMETLQTEKNSKGAEPQKTGGRKRAHNED